MDLMKERRVVLMIGGDYPARDRKRPWHIILLPFKRVSLSETR